MGSGSVLYGTEERALSNSKALLRAHGRIKPKSFSCLGTGFRFNGVERFDFSSDCGVVAFMICSVMQWPSWRKFDVKEW
jgi:hypothetical protein